MKKQSVIDHFGGVSEVAKALGIKHPAVCRWPDVIPELRARQLDELTNGSLKFNPDDYRKSSH
ncbi:Cro/CI family transcriptional regulator [Pseudaeromonas pectinilytica]